MARSLQELEYYKESSGDQHVGACPCCGGDDRFWIYFRGTHVTTFGCRGCTPEKHTWEVAELSRALNGLVGVRASTDKWKILRAHEYRTSKGKVRHVKAIPTRKAKPATYWQHWGEGAKRWQSKMGRNVKMGDLLWNQWTHLHRIEDPNNELKSASRIRYRGAWMSY